MRFGRLGYLHSFYLCSKPQKDWARKKRIARTGKERPGEVRPPPVRFFVAAGTNGGGFKTGLEPMAGGWKEGGGGYGKCSLEGGKVRPKREVNSRNTSLRGGDVIHVVYFF